MIKISSIVEAYIANSPFLGEALKEDLVNVSALARKLQPEIEEKLKKPVQHSAIMMAIKRLPPSRPLLIERDLRRFFGKISDISVRSNLVDFTYRNSSTLLEKLIELLNLIRKRPNSFYSFSQGITETTIVVTDAVAERMNDLFNQEELRDRLDDLSSITMLLPEENRTIYGVYYYILKELAWKGVNLIEVISTSNEITILVKNEDLNKAFGILSDLRKR